jgi:dynein intermediate chain 2, axonemal
MASYSPTKFIFGTEQNIIVSCTRRKNKPLQIDRCYLGHHGPVYSVIRNQFLPSYFLSIGDWSAKIWHEDLSYPIYSTNFCKNYLTRGCWSPKRAGVFFTTKMDGSLDIWDLTDKTEDPVVTVNVSSAPLYSLLVNKKGNVVAVGDSLGQTSLIELNLDISSGANKKEVEEKEKFQAILERETKREKLVEENKKLIDLEKKKDKKSLEENIKSSYSSSNLIQIEETNILKELTQKFQETTK